MKGSVYCSISNGTKTFSKVSGAVLHLTFIPLYRVGQKQTINNLKMNTLIEN